MTLLNSSTLYASYAFTNALPIPDVIDTKHRKAIHLQVRETEQFLGLYDVSGDPLLTTVWGYGTGQTISYPGPTILAYEGQSITVTWQNKLPLEGHILAIDTSIHTAAPANPGAVPIVTHLHGGHTSSASDGLPDAWFTQRGHGAFETGAGYVSNSSYYENDQQAATLWYHDHALGMTRLNVYAGLAGYYILQDEERLALVKKGVLPDAQHDIGLAIQDRAFTDDGQLYYPAYKNDILPGTNETVGDMIPQAFYDRYGEGAPSVVPEFFGDTILVNGMAWPNLDVGAGDYQFRLLNGSDSRFYVLRVSDPHVTVHLVGTDGGLLPTAETLINGDGVQDAHEFIVLVPGDRVDLVFEFDGLKNGTQIKLLNAGPTFEPFKGVHADGTLVGEAEAASPEDPVGNIMQFTVKNEIAAKQVSIDDGTILSRQFVSLTQDWNSDDIADLADHVRKLGLFEGTDAYGRIKPMLGTAEQGAVHSSIHHPDGAFGPLMFDAPVTETPELGAFEQWEFFNFTADSHPIHIHLTQYQVVEKRKIDFIDDDENGIPDDTNGDGIISYGNGAIDYAEADIWIGNKTTIRPEETGWQDTVRVDPGEMMSVIAGFDRPGDYVWHCHILSHEDYDMMRPFTVLGESAIA